MCDICGLLYFDTTNNFRDNSIKKYTRTGRNLYLKHSIVSFVGLKRALTETEVISVA